MIYMIETILEYNVSYADTGKSAMEGHFLFHGFLADPTPVTLTAGIAKSAKIRSLFQSFF